VVSDLIRGRPIWFGGADRSEASMQQFFDWLGENKAKRSRLAVMESAGQDGPATRPEDGHVETVSQGDAKSRAKSGHLVR
jgi:hypothetical protein